MARPFIVSSKHGGSGIISAKRSGPQLAELMSGLRIGQPIEWVESQKAGAIQSLHSGKVVNITFKGESAEIHCKELVHNGERLVIIRQPKTAVRPPFVLAY